MTTHDEPEFSRHPEFSRRFALDRLALAAGPVAVSVEAEAGECVALARRFGLVSLGRLAATIRLDRRAGTRLIVAEGTLAAELVQTCVVTLEPFAAELEAPFTALYAVHDGAGPAHAAAPSGAAGMGEDGTPDDEAEPIEDGALDLGELVAQHLSLALDPYPRAPGVSFDQYWSGERSQGPDSPFAVLRPLRSPS